VLNAAAHMFAVHGAQAATIEQIAREAGVTRQAVYEQFGDRAALFAQVVAVVEERAFAAIGAHAQDGWQPELRSWVRDNYANMFAFVAANPDSFPVLREAERAGDLALTRLRGGWRRSTPRRAVSAGPRMASSRDARTGCWSPSTSR
jgi:AcrR family transcriptional regulator